MKCTLTLDQHVNPANAPEYLKPSIKFWFVNEVHPTKGKQRKPVPYIPAGTILEHDVIGFITRGQAIPADEEAATACGFTPEELAIRQNAYKRISAGIDPADFDLFDAGVITGYTKAGEYVPGPNWEGYMQSRKEAEATPTTDI
jgi:hypothetical protein